MRSTNLLAELLIIGAWGCSWAIPISVILIKKEYLVKSSEIGIGTFIFALSFIYFLGMFISFCADIVTKPLNNYVLKKYGDRNSINKLRVKISKNDSESFNYIQQRRSFVRIYRANVINFSILTIVLFFDVSNVSNIFCCSNYTIATISFSVFLFCLFAYQRTLHGYFDFIIKSGNVH